MLVFKQRCCCEAELVPELLTSLVPSPRALCNPCWPLASSWLHTVLSGGGWTPGSFLVLRHRWQLSQVWGSWSCPSITSPPSGGFSSLQLFPLLQWKGQCPTLFCRGSCSLKLFSLIKANET